MHLTKKELLLTFSIIIILSFASSAVWAIAKPFSTPNTYVFTDKTGELDSAYAGADIKKVTAKLNKNDLYLKIETVKKLLKNTPGDWGIGIDNNNNSKNDWQINFNYNTKKAWFFELADNDDYSNPLPLKAQIKTGSNWVEIRVNISPLGAIENRQLWYLWSQVFADSTYYIDNIVLSFPDVNNIGHLDKLTESELEIIKNQPVALELPVKGSWLIVQGQKNDNITHKTGGDVEYALDFNKADKYRETRANETSMKTLVNEDGSYQSENQTLYNADMYSWGEPVYAVADGEVIQAINNHPDHEMGNIDPTQNQNQLVIKHSENLYSFYAHFQEGSLTVEIGQMVKKGQMVGRVGNSGPSSGPHLHFHITKFFDPTTEDRFSMPVVFSKYKVVVGNKKIPVKVGVPMEGEIVEK